MAVRAITRNFGTSSKKVRRILRLIKGKGAQEAQAVLRLYPSPAAQAVAKTLKSAVANAENRLMAPEELKIVKAVADEGPRLKRFRPQARGRSSPIQRRSCHITIEVDEEGALRGT